MFFLLFLRIWFLLYTKINIAKDLVNSKKIRTHAIFRSRVLKSVLDETQFVQTYGKNIYLRKIMSTLTFRGELPLK